MAKPKQTKPKAEVPYSTSFDEKWWKVVEGWEWVKMGEKSWQKTGPCPRCGHTISAVYEELVILRRLEFGPLSSQPPATIRCNCAQTHAEGEEGCGQAGNFTPPK